MMTRRLAWMLASLLVLSLVAAGHFESFAAAGPATVNISALTLSKSSVTSGESLTAQASIKNSGGRTGSLYVSFWIAPVSSTAAPSRLGRTSLGRMHPHATVTLVAALSIPSATPSGSYRVIANVETSAGTPSTDTKTATLSVHQPSLASSPSMLSPTDSTTDLNTDTEPPTDDSLSASPPSTTTSTTSEPTSSSSTFSGSTATTPQAATTSPTTDPTPTSLSTPCDYYASPNGSANGRMTSSPFRIQDFWSVATPGTTLCLVDGTYRGAGNMISPSSGLSGTSTAPITIRALNDGRVLIDGEFVRTPISLAGVQWFDIEGINFRNSGGSVIFVSAGSRNVNFRRVVAWDANMTRNVHVVLVTGSDSIRFFDAGFFGTGRKVWSPSMKNTSKTECHRCWIRWEGTNNGGAGAATMQYNAYGTKLIDSLVTWDAISQPENYCVTDATGNCTGTLRSNFSLSSPLGFHIFNDHSPDSCSQARLHGVLAYTTAKQHINVSTNYRSIRLGPAGSSMIGSADITCTHLDHVAVVVSPSNPWKGGGYFLSPLDDLTTDKIARHITAIAAGPNTFGSNWDVPSGSRFISTTIPPIGSATHPWTQSGTAGANLCYRYGTTTPMWPFPMNERIKQATAMAGAYRGPCVQCSGTMPRARTATDVTADAEALLGPIPAKCRTDR